MKKLLLASVLLVPLAACLGLSSEEKQAFRDNIAQAAIDIIAKANEQGINPVEMDEDKLRVVHFACGAAKAFSPFVDAYVEARHVEDPAFEPIDFKGYVAAACAVADVLIQPKAPDEAPVPEPAPEA